MRVETKLLPGPMSGQDQNPNEYSEQVGLTQGLSKHKLHCAACVQSSWQVITFPFIYF